MKIVAANEGPRTGWKKQTDWSWSLFNPETKRERFNTVFPEGLRKFLNLEHHW